MDNYYTIWAKFQIIKALSMQLFDADRTARQLRQRLDFQEISLNFSNNKHFCESHNSNTIQVSLHSYMRYKFNLCLISPLRATKPSELMQ